MAELFCVYQFFSDGTNERVRSNVPAKEAFEAWRHYSTSVAAKIGTTIRTMITDQGDYCCAEWTKENGIIFPLEAKGLF